MHTLKINSVTPSSGVSFGSNEQTGDGKGTLFVCGNDGAVIGNEDGKYNTFQLPSFNVGYASASSSNIAIDGTFIESSYLFALKANDKLLIHDSSPFHLQTKATVTTGGMLIVGLIFYYDNLLY